MLKEGDSFPEFSLPDQSGETKSFSDLSGPKGMVLYAYPKDNTPGCTLEAKDFRDRLAEFQALGFSVVGLSKDSVKSHCSFVEKHDLPFSLLSDRERSLCEATGAWGEKKNYGRTYMGLIRSTFVVNAGAMVLKVYPKVRAKGHVERVLQDLKILA